MKRSCELLTLALVAMCISTVTAQVPSAVNEAMVVPASKWAIDAAQNELKVLEYGHTYLRYLIHSKDRKGDQVRDVIQSRDGAVARLILKEGRALSPEEDAAEHERLNTILDSPATYARHVKGDVSGKKMGSDLIKLTPDAMLFTYAPGQPRRTGYEGETPEIVIDFKPNPEWTPPSMTAEALTGFEGRVWIDARTHYMTRLEGTIFRGMNFGWGFFAHIYPGGRVMFEQTQVNEQRWIFSRFSERINLRVVFKNVKEDSDLEGSHFVQVPEMSYQDAIHLLLATPLNAH